jgi:short-subunit dehydrogenase
MTTANPTVMILGGTSGIGRAVARDYAARGYAIQLAGRDQAGLENNGRDLMVRYGVAVSIHPIDALEFATHAAFVDSLEPLPDTLVCAIGSMKEQEECERDPDEAELVMCSNFNGPAHILGFFASRFAARRSGTIVGISSVAGDRGRAGNYVYGSAKAAFTAFLSGLRARLAPFGVRVITVKPGFVRTRMTDGMKLPALLTAAPEEVAAAIGKAERRRRDIVYVRRLWRPIMAIVRALPEPIFKRTRF